MDRLGGLEDALAEARKLGALPEQSPVDVYPPDPTLMDFLEGFLGGVSASAHVEQRVTRALAPFTALVPGAAAVSHSLASLAGFATEPVRTVLLLPFLR